MRHDACVDRRTFNTLASVAFVQTVFSQRLLAEPVRLAARPWLRDIETLCNDLRVRKLRPEQWQLAIGRLHERFSVDDLAELVDLDAVARRFRYPRRGVVTFDPDLPGIIGGTEFIGRIFGMAKGRAIIPHGHQNMVSAHRVIGGEFRLRQYDRVHEDEGALWIRPWIDETVRRGTTSAISDLKGNVHWLVATTARAFTFDVIVVGLSGARETRIDNLDMDRAQCEGSELLRVPILDVKTALARYG